MTFHDQMPCTKTLGSSNTQYLTYSGPMVYKEKKIRNIKGCVLLCGRRRPRRTCKQAYVPSYVLRMPSLNPESWPIHQRFLTALSFITFFLVAITLPWFIKSRNIGCILYIFWVGLQCLGHFINDIIWSDNTAYHAPIWCEIWIRFEFASSMGVVCAGLVIARRISNVVTVTTATLPKEDRRRQMYTDLAIGLVPPSTQLIAFYFIQGHRYNIFEGLGCSLATPSSILYISLTSIWGVIIGLISAFYCCRTLYALYKRHRQIKQVLLASNVDMQHFYRLIAMAVIEMCSTVPLCLWSLVTCVESYYPWNGFADLHLDFDRIERYPALLWITIGEYSTLEDQWFSVGCGLIFFGIFGFTQEARNKYRQLLGLPATKIPAPIFTPEGSQPQQGRVLTVWPYWWKMRRTEDHARTTLEFHIETSQTRLSSQTVAQQTNTDSIV
ncbi:unnamed protein product [Somion occarium]|uniref:Pheromone receptor n=1 Tax=Somion occarium TaxID=3059160 RepID=A0ABP1CPF7_9APHY